MKSTLWWCGCVLALGCGAKGEAAPAKPPSAATTTAAPVLAPVATGAGPCIVLELHSRPFPAEPPAAHEELGFLVLNPDKGACTLEAHDKSGALKSTKPCNSSDDAATLDLVQHAVCELGGEVYWLDGKPVDDAPVRMKIGRYTRHDEAADVGMVCAPFASLKNLRTGGGVEGNLDDLQRGRIRAEILEGSMTSPKWRLWLRDLGRAMLDGKDREPILDELRKAAKAQSMSSCEAEWLKPAS